MIKQQRQGVIEKMSVRLKYFAKAVIFGALSATLAITAVSAAVGDELSLRTRSAEIYERLSEPAQPLVIDVNSASVRELQKLNGIGEVTANAIAAYREENGDFVTTEDLLNVKGIGQATLEKIRPYISL